MKSIKDQINVAFKYLSTIYNHHYNYDVRTYIRNLLQIIANKNTELLIALIGAYYLNYNTGVRPNIYGEMSSLKCFNSFTLKYTIST